MDNKKRLIENTVIKFGKPSYHLRKEMIEWCTEAFGAPADYWKSVAKDTPVSWSHTTDFGNTRFYFSTAEQVAWFKLRWP